MRTIYRDCVVGLIVSRDGKILLGKKDPKNGGVYANCWHLPGGGVDARESDAEALAREMKEEVGIDISTTPKTLLDDTGKGESNKELHETGEVVLCKMTFKVYRIELDKNALEIEVMPGDDITKTIWLEPTQLREYKLTPPSVELFRRLGFLP